MSLDAYCWADDQIIPDAAAKLVLLTICDNSSRYAPPVTYHEMEERMAQQMTPALLAWHLENLRQRKFITIREEETDEGKGITAIRPQIPGDRWS